MKDIKPADGELSGSTKNGTHEKPAESGVTTEAGKLARAIRAMFTPERLFLWNNYHFCLP